MERIKLYLIPLIFDGIAENFTIQHLSVLLWILYFGTEILYKITILHIIRTCFSNFEKFVTCLICYRSFTTVIFTFEITIKATVYFFWLKIAYFLYFIVPFFSSFILKADNKKSWTHNTQFYVKLYLASILNYSNLLNT